MAPKGWHRGQGAQSWWPWESSWEAQSQAWLGGQEVLNGLPLCRLEGGLPASGAVLANALQQESARGGAPEAGRGREWGALPLGESGAAGRCSCRWGGGRWC